MAGDVNCVFAILQRAEISAISATDVSFFTRSAEGTREEYTVKTSQILATPPAQAPKPVPLTVGAVGNLYMTREAWATKSAAGNLIYESTNCKIVLFKWPQCKPYRTIEDLSITPTSMVLTFVYSGKVGSIDLVGSDCAPSQFITWNAAQPITVSLSPAGQAKYNNQSSIDVWPTKLEVTGTPPKPAITGTVDALDAHYADFTQDLTWDAGQAVTFRLSTEGFNQFDAPTDALRNVAAGYPTAYPMDIVKEWLDLQRGHKLSANGNVSALLKRAIASLPAEQRAQLEA